MIIPGHGNENYVGYYSDKVEDRALTVASTATDSMTSEMSQFFALGTAY